MKFRLLHSRMLPYYIKVEMGRRQFEKKLSEIESVSSTDLRISKAIELAKYASFTPTGHLCSYRLEKFFLDVADKIKVKIDNDYEENTFLHVLSFPFEEGGLIRAVQSWINRSEEHQKHTIVFIDDDGHIPGWLYETVSNHGGKIIVLDKDNVFDKASELRLLASRFEHIILHTFLYESVAILAFGTNDFKRPVILFNHTDHLFWMGVTVADVVANIRYGVQSDKRRCVKNSCFLGVPPRTYEDNHQLLTKGELRENLGIPKDAFVVLSTGGSNKYNPVAGISLNPILERLVNKDDSVYVILIGPSKESRKWNRTYINTKERVNAIGMIKDSDVYQKYLKAADLYLNSYPCGGFTALMDAVQSGLPFVQLKFTRQRNDGIVGHDGMYNVLSERKLIHTILKAKNEPVFYEHLLNQSRSWYDEYCNPNQWKQRLEKLYRDCPDNHNVSSLNNKEQVVIDDVTVLNGFIYLGGFDYRNLILKGFSRIWVRLWK